MGGKVMNFALVENSATSSFLHVAGKIIMKNQS